MASEAVISIPCDMPEGYTFQAVVDGHEIPVTVPPGGVKQGQELRIPVTTPTQNNHAYAGAGLATPVHSVLETAQVPIGAWRNELCDCGQVCCSGLWWLAACCSPLVLGQMLSRMQLDFCGSPAATEEQARNACTIVVICFLVSLLGNGILPGLSCAFVIYVLVYGTNLRSYMRSKYKIPGSCCEGCMEDCCCIFWCGCCVSIQMARHTHGDGYYDCCKHNGLRPGAPVVV